jgi:hypothetical protein
MAACRFCGGSIDECERCPHCGARLRKAPERAVLAPVAESGIESATREARLFLVGAGVVLLLLWLSAASLRADDFGRGSFFGAVVASREAILGLGAGLLASGALFWRTGRVGFAYVGGVAWIGVALLPLFVYLRVVAALAEATGEATAIVWPALWLAAATTPLVRFRELAIARERVAALTA